MVSPNDYRLSLPVTETKVDVNKRLHFVKMTRNTGIYVVSIAGCTCVPVSANDAQASRSGTDARVRAKRRQYLGWVRTAHNHPHMYTYDFLYHDLVDVYASAWQYTWRGLCGAVRGCNPPLPTKKNNLEIFFTKYWSAVVVLQSGNPNKCSLKMCKLHN